MCSEMMPVMSASKRLACQQPILVHLCVYTQSTLLPRGPLPSGVPHRRSSTLLHPQDGLNAMPLKLVPAEPLPPFTFSPPPPSPTSDALAPRPPADFLPERDMTMFGPLPLRGQGEEGRGLVKCTRCGRPSMEWAAAEHKSESGDIIIPLKAHTYQPVGSD